MPIDINEQSSFDSNIQVPSTGDKGYGITVQSAVQKLANRTKWLKDNQLVGPTGPQGIPGPQGPQGVAGANGTNGVDGVDGTAGFDTINGLTNPGGSIYIQAGSNVTITDNGIDTITINSTVSGGSVDTSNFVTHTELYAVTGSLQTQINTANKNINNLAAVTGSYLTAANLAPYTLLTTTASVSAGLNTRLTTVENNYATKNTTTAGTYNTVIVNSQGIVTSGGNVGYVLKSGDTMTGPLTISTTGSLSLKINSDTADGNAIVINSDSAKTGFSSIVFSKDNIPGVTLLAGVDLTNYAVFNLIDNATFVGNTILDYTVSDGSALINPNGPQLVTQSNVLIGTDYPDIANNTGNVFIGNNGNIAITRAMNNNIYNYTLTSNTSGGLQLAANNNIYYFNNNGVFDAPNVRVRGVSGLNNAIVTHDTNGNLLNSGYTVSSITGGLITSSTVAAISGSLNVRLTAVENSYATNATVQIVSGGLQTQINTKQNDITLVAGSNVIIVESPTDTWTISANISGSSGIQYVSAPVSPTSSGTQGQRAYSSNYVYECIATNTWVRYAAASSW